MTGSQVTQVDDIARDNQKLEEKARFLCGEDVTLDSEETIGPNLGTGEPSMCAILVKMDSAWGAVRVFSEPVTNVVTSPTQGAGFVIIVVKRGQDCRLFGSPSLRYFRRRGS